MKTLRILLLIILSFCLAAPAQQRILTIEDIVLRGRTSLAPQRLIHLKWIKGTDNYSYTDTTGEKKLMRGSLQGAPNVLITLRQLNACLRTAGHDTLNDIPEPHWISHRAFRFASNDTLFYIDLPTRHIQLLFMPPAGKKAAHITPHDHHTSVAFTVDNNLFLYHNGRHIAITHDTNVHIVNGQAVHREEFGIHEGIYWSPRGNLLAFYRMDQTMVTDYPITEWDEKPARQRLIKYPFAGDSSHQVQVGVYNLKTGRTIFLETGEPLDQYLTNLAWSPDEKKIYLVIVNRTQDHLWFNRYDANTGRFEKTLFEEHDDRYVHPLNRMVFNPANAAQFIWQSRRDGWNHLYLYDTTGHLLRQLTSGRWEVTRLEGFNPSGTRIYFEAADSPVTRQLFYVETATGKIKQLTRQDGIHLFTGNEQKNLFLVQFTSLKVPRQVTIVDGEGRLKKALLNAANPLQEFIPVDISVFTIKSQSGFDLYCRLTRPSSLREGKRYPVVVYVYNGPGVQLVQNQWPAGHELWYHYMAQHGYIVFTIDGRGTANRGAAFEQAIFRQLGVAECEDQIDGVNYLKTLPFVDSTRIGIYGWSYGGFMTATLMTRNPEVFKAGVAGGPVMDWRLYEVMYTERYMDTPEENPVGYERSSVLNKVHQLKGKMLVIHGTDDDIVVQQHSMWFLKKAIEQGKQVDFFLYPGHEHNILGKDRIHLLQKISEYFFSHL
jgi:dipeptidyl-peptidase-4